MLCGKKERRFRICMVSDFFYPNLGGVESHIYYLSHYLMEMGHKVIMVTHAYDERKGIRYLANGLKVYYLPIKVMYNQSTLPTFWTFLKLFRDIMIRERIELIHGHQAFSTLMHEFLLHGRVMGFPTVFTDHSLFGFSDTSNILMNKILSFTLCDIDQVICVSYTSKENTVLRSKVAPDIVSVIPNAIDSSLYTPRRTKKTSDEIVIVSISRMVYRKGVELLIETIPIVCRNHPKVRFIIGGDGPKKPNVEEMIRHHKLGDRVKLLGEINSDQVRDTLVEGDIFLNCSLTEAFCMAIVEAASCGLIVVSTRVGGIPEVLPESLMKLADPFPKDLSDAVDDAILEVGQKDPIESHKQVSKMYSWADIAERTCQVYEKALRVPNRSPYERFVRNLEHGPFSGLVFCLVLIMDYLLLLLLDWLYPRSDIETAVDFPRQKHIQTMKTHKHVIQSLWAQHTPIKST